MRAVLALYDKTEHAENAIARLREVGFGEHNLSLLTHSDASKVGELLDNKPENSAASGSMIGVGVGSLLGLLGGITFIPISGTEISLLVSGLMGTMGGGAIGAYLGGLYGERAATNPEYEFKEKLANDDAILLVAHPDAEDKETETTAINIMKDTAGEYVGLYELHGEEFEPFNVERKLEEEAS